MMGVFRDSVETIILESHKFARFQTNKFDLGKAKEYLDVVLKYRSFSLE